MSIRSWFKWMARKRYLLRNAASEIDLPKLGMHLPKHVLSASQVEEVFAAVDLKTGFGLRDRAMLETLYSTSIRRMELTNLRLADIDEERGVLTVRQGKGKRDRVVPIGERAMRWILQVHRRVTTEARRQRSRDSGLSNKAR